MMPEVVKPHPLQSSRLLPFFKGTTGVSPAISFLQLNEHIGAANHPHQRVQPLEGEVGKRNIRQLGRTSAILLA